MIFLLWALGSLLVSLTIWVLVPTMVLGWEPMAVVSDSMRPALRTGDVVLIDPGEPYRAGSIVAFEQEDSTVVHRVVGMDDGVLTTRGDANDASDSSPVRMSAVVGTARLVVPYIGLTRAVGWGWLGAIAAIVALSVSTWRSRPLAAATMAVVAMGVGALALATSVFTTGTGTDNSSLTAVEVLPPTNVDAACGLAGAGSLDVDMTWSSSVTAGVTGYVVYHDDPSAGTDYVEVGTTSGAETSFTHQVPTTILSLGAHTYVVRAEVGPWQSVDSSSDAVSITQIVVTYICTEL